MEREEAGVQVPPRRQQAQGRQQVAEGRQLARGDVKVGGQVQRALRMHVWLTLAMLYETTRLHS